MSCFFWKPQAFKVSHFANSLFKHGFSLISKLNFVPGIIIDGQTLKSLENNDSKMVLPSSSIQLANY